MNVYKICDIGELLSEVSYLGRGIVVGESADAKCACCAYFISGRSANSRNRVFAERDGVLYTEPFVPSAPSAPLAPSATSAASAPPAASAPSAASAAEGTALTLYAALCRYENRLIVSNGDQTDTIRRAFSEGKTLADALKTRRFEPDFPHLTPRISAVLSFEGGSFSYELAVVKSADEKGSACMRSLFSYEPLAGLGHFLHTYMSDGDPLPSFAGEPRRVFVDAGIDAFTDRIWRALDAENRISLYVRYTDLKSGESESRLINKNVGREVQICGN